MLMPIMILFPLDCMRLIFIFTYLGVPSSTTRNVKENTPCSSSAWMIFSLVHAALKDS